LSRTEDDQLRSVIIRHDVAAQDVQGHKSGAEDARRAAEAAAPPAPEKASANFQANESSTFRARAGEACSRARRPIYFPIAFRNASLILSCQPGPASWK
jgi:hypothetical protein